LGDGSDSAATTVNLMRLFLISTVASWSNYDTGVSYHFDFVLHLTTDGMTQTNIITAETKKIKRTEVRNLNTSTVEVSDDLPKELENNCSAACRGITLVIVCSIIILETSDSASAAQQIMA